MQCLRVPGTPSRSGESVLTGVAEIRAALQPDQDGWRDAFHTHITTVATNALIEQGGARVGLIVTLGFRHLHDGGPGPYAAAAVSEILARLAAELAGAVRQGGTAQAIPPRGTAACAALFCSTAPARCSA